MGQEGDKDRPSGEHQEATSKVTEAESGSAISSEHQTSGAPPPSRTPEYKQTQAYAYLLLASQYVIATVALVGIVLAICSLRSVNKSVKAANRQAVAAATQNQNTLDIFHSSSRPYLGIGDPGGTFGELLPTKGPLGQPRFVLYVFNAGHSPALNVRVIPIGLGGKEQGAHLQRYKHPNGTIDLCNEGYTAPPNSITLFYVPDTALVPIRDQPQPDNSCEFLGRIEYCDQFGQFHCDGFSAYYHGGDRIWERGISPECRTSFMSEAKGGCYSYRIGTSDSYLPLPRCEQPKEREEKEQRDRAAAAAV